MVFWIVAAALTFGICLVLLAPLARGRADAADSRAHEIEVYKDQLLEIDRDTARGLISSGEAELARAEIGRKIIRLSDARDAAASMPRSHSLARWIGALAILSLPLVSWGLYAATGSPGYADQPLQARLHSDPSQASVDELIARAEAHLATKPDDARGWDVLAPIYLRLGRYADAATAFANASRLDEPTAARLAGEGEALAAAANGRVTEDALARFEQALALAPDDLRSRYFVALAADQAGNGDEARRMWQDMRADLPEGSPWHGVIAAALESDGADMLSERSEAIEGMVAGLAARLEVNSNDVDGWQQLIRSYMVLDRPQEAQSALERARDALGAGSPEAGHLAAFGLSLGLEVER
ncbi:c-type cytochrome biogenesis protein CcmI [Mesorhizobium sp. YIM 152430]|uniref:c-type cytochrome biogenesis protein CcmI n=1 Tax=Mesorhizobium sp. YIM 152430 TaxID=3031761 RepID=UPI0023DC8A34|nr:c-type cytochrome biogenesis protein CcmI [Mesorhizobium sp. YIM 152430]MDF1601338.1 c-type cytochrome biogenesis protein CcmI [Mesorhizobium sp. YIM 152430]